MTGFVQMGHICKKTKETVFFRYWLNYYQKCIIEISLNLCTELTCYNETVQIFF